MALAGREYTRPFDLNIRAKCFLLPASPRIEAVVKINENEIDIDEARGEPVLFTIRYEGRSIENFINELIVNDVRMLVDVRKNPISRKFGFSKSKLEHIAETVGIKYVHLPELGIESQDRSFLKTRDDYRLLFAEYEKSLNQREQPLNHLYSLFEAHSRIALVCFEKEPERAAATLCAII